MCVRTYTKTHTYTHILLTFWNSR